MRIVLGGNGGGTAGVLRHPEHVPGYGTVANGRADEVRPGPDEVAVRVDAGGTSFFATWLVGKDEEFRAERPEMDGQYYLMGPSPEVMLMTARDTLDREARAKIHDAVERTAAPDLLLAVQGSYLGKEGFDSTAAKRLVDVAHALGGLAEQEGWTMGQLSGWIATMESAREAADQLGGRATVEEMCAHYAERGMTPEVAALDGLARELGRIERTSGPEQETSQSR